LKELPDLPTEGQRPPREEVNSKNVSMTVTTVLDPPDLPFPPEDLFEEDDETAAAEEVVATDASD